jgi:hypothetical protein
LPDSWHDARQRALLDALVDHPLARTLRFADPLEILPAPLTFSDSGRTLAISATDGGSQ